MSCNFPSPDFSLPITRTQLYLGFIFQEDLIPELGFSRWFLVLNVPSGLHLVVNSVFTYMRCVFIIDFDNDKPTFFRVSLILLGVMKGLFFAKERIL